MSPSETVRKRNGFLKAAAKSAPGQMNLLGTGLARGAGVPVGEPWVWVEEGQPRPLWVWVPAPRL
jgi:hypothetical protein